MGVTTISTIQFFCCPIFEETKTSTLLSIIRYPAIVTITLLLLISSLLAQTNAAVKLPNTPNRTEISDGALKQYGMNDEQRLFKHIIRITTFPYDQFGMQAQLNQVLTLNVWVEQIWRDERIRWDPVEFGNISKLTVGKKYLWTPDIVLYNNARDFSRGFVDTNLHIMNNGDTQWAPPAKVYSICKLDVRYFPFDDQFCLLEFGSWIYDQSQLDVQIMERFDGKNPFTRDSFIENGEWEIVANRTRKVLRGRQTAFSTIVFELHLRRRVLYFIYNIIAPCFMLSMLTMMQFLLPCESGEK
ncbi:Nicotinic acetylcholine receptor non-alpha subunit 27 [Dirofilaria immitis]|nr:Nicotinic acetylcholine receptor non-alpha subunit 27 [Dirofilaria immitis]